METNVTLYGASGHCKVIVGILHNCEIPIESIIDDFVKLKTVLGHKVICTNEVDFDKVDNLIISIGNNKIRKILAGKILKNYIKAIHPTAIISNHATIGDGTVIMAGAIVNPDVKIGKHCIINSAAVIEHDCIIDDFAHISPNASLAGGVHVGEGTHVGIGATVIQGIKIGKWVTIGAGTVIINDIPDYAVVVGIPGKIIKYNNEND